MSELGSNQGQDENKNGPVFDSSKLSKEQTTEHFTNVKDVEDRAKAAEREAKEVEKKAQKEHAANIRSVSKQMKNELKDNGIQKKKNKIILPIAVCVVLILGLLAFWLVCGLLDKVSTKKDEAAQEYALSIYRDIETIQEEESLDAAREKMESTIESASDAQKVYLSMYYAEFLASRTGDEVTALEWLEKAQSYCKNDKELEDVSGEYAKIVMILDEDEFEFELDEWGEN